jgi:hypothetical protein
VFYKYRCAARLWRGQVLAALREIFYLSSMKSARIIRRLIILAGHRHAHSDIEKLLKIPYVLFLIHYECPVKIKISAWGLHLPINGHPSNEANVLWRLKYLYDT